ncbi:MAG: carbohydrate porin [Candidatus Binataceae bacterium]|jgi:outer membrane protease
MASNHAAISILNADGPGADISAARAYRYKYGFGLNWEQEVAENVGLFSRLGWNDGDEQAHAYTDVNWTTSLGVSVKGDTWRRPGDTFGVAGGSWRVTRLQQLDFDVGFGLNRSSPDHFFGIGYSFRLDGPFGGSIGNSP